MTAPEPLWRCLECNWTGSYFAVLRDPSEHWSLDICPKCGGDCTPVED